MIYVLCGDGIVRDDGTNDKAAHQARKRTV